MLQCFSHSLCPPLPPTALLRHRAQTVRNSDLSHKTDFVVQDVDMDVFNIKGYPILFFKYYALHPFLIYSEFLKISKYFLIDKKGQNHLWDSGSRMLIAISQPFLEVVRGCEGKHDDSPTFFGIWGEWYFGHSSWMH